MFAFLSAERGEQLELDFLKDFGQLLISRASSCRERDDADAGVRRVASATEEP